MKNAFCAVCAMFAMVVHAGVGTMTSTPLWDLADHGGARAVSSAAPLEVPMSALPGFNFSAFTVETTLTFGEVPDLYGFVIMDQELSETGWAVRGRKISTAGNPVYLACNGEQYGCSYGMGGVEAGSTHTFTLAVRGGWIVVYMDGKIQKSYRMVPTPNEQPIRVGAPLPSGWREFAGVRLESFKVWGEDEAYYAPGEPTEAATGYVGGKGWLVEVPTEPIPGRPNVLYVGDSISDGYSTPFKLCTKGLANLYHWTASFGTPGAAGVPAQKIAEVCALADFDRVVFNNGLHSLNWTESAVSDADVTASYRELVARFRAGAPRAGLYYIATTPYTLAKNAQGVVTGLDPKNEVVLRLNRLARPVMDAAEVPWIDAYSLFVDRLDLARGDQYHWNAPAYELLASTVAQTIGISLTSADLAPGADVVVPGWDRLVVTDAELPAVSSLNSLTILAGGEVAFDLASGGDLACVVTNGGRVVKTGAGALRVAHAAKQSWKGELEIEQGVFWCPQDLANGANFDLGRTTVHAGATLVTALSTANNGNTQVNGLWGDGDVTNTSTGASAQLRVTNTGAPCVFGGRILGRGIRWYSNGNVWLTGTNSNFSGSMQIWGGYDQPNVRGTTAMKLIGRRGQPSSLGLANALEPRENGGTFLYLGDGETTDRDFHFWNNPGEFSYYWDAGATGGVTFTGTWSHDSARAERLYLQGSNTVPCVVRGAWSGDAANRPTYLVKRGTGTWRFEDHAERKNAGGIAVEEGVLQFTSIANVGEICSLGLATALQTPYVGAYDASRNADHAYRLGTAKSRGTLEFVGTSASASADRAFAVEGEGEVRNSAADASATLKLAGAHAAKPGANTLVLGGDAASKAFFDDVADGSAGTLGVAKEGTGTWVLGGDASFSGPLAVKAGVLEVQGLHTNAFTWFKFVIRGNAFLHTGANDLNVCFYGLEFYDADGVNQTRGDNMAFKASYAAPSGAKAVAGDWRNLQPGEYAWARTAGRYSYYTTRDIDGIFKIDKTGARVCVAWDSPNIALASPDTHAPIVIRLPEGANRVVAFDVLASFAKSNGRALSDWTLYGSEDGVDWVEVARNDWDTGTMPSGGNWFSDNSPHVQGAARPGTGYSCEKVSGRAGALRNVSAVSVAPGATLRAVGDVALPVLALDCAAGAGAFEGFDFAETGVVELTRVAEDTFRLPGTFTGCRNLGNLSKWTVCIDGEVQRSRRVAAVGDRLLLASNGTAVLVR